MTSATAGTTVPLNWDTSKLNCNGGGAFDSCKDLNARWSYASHGFKSKHPGGGNFLFADGSVKFLKSSINPLTYNSLGSRNGGEIVSCRRLLSG